MHSLAIVLNETELTNRLLDRIRSSLPPEGYEVVPWWQLADFYNKVAALYARQFGLVKLIIAAVIVLGIGNTMMMSVLERTSEIGTAMALGKRRSAILRSFMLEGALIGAVGGLVGLGGGMVLAIVVSAIGIPMPPSPGMSHGFVAGIRLTAGLAAEGIALALAAALLASAHPAWRASRMNIVDAIRVGR